MDIVMAIGQDAVGMTGRHVWLPARLAMWSRGLLRRRSWSHRWRCEVQQSMMSEGPEAREKPRNGDDRCSQSDLRASVLSLDLSAGIRMRTGRRDGHGQAVGCSKGLRCS